MKNSKNMFKKFEDIKTLKIIMLDRELPRYLIENQQNTFQ